MPDDAAANSLKKTSASKNNIKNFNVSRTKAEVDVAVAAAIAATKVKSDAEIAHLKKTVDDLAKQVKAQMRKENEQDCLDAAEAVAVCMLY